MLIHFNIHELLGQLDFNKIRKKFFIKIDGVLLVFDLHNGNALNRLNDWFEFILDRTKSDGFPPLILIGNKNDLPTQVNRNVLDKTRTNWEKKVQMSIPFFLVSAKFDRQDLALDQTSLFNVFHELGILIYQNNLKNNVKYEGKFIVNILLVGDSMAGKTSINHVFTGKGFDPGYLMTLGPPFGIREIELEIDNEQIQ